jgi:hypothetical protein
MVARSDCWLERAGPAAELGLLHLGGPWGEPVHPSGLAMQPCSCAA